MDTSSEHKKNCFVSAFLILTTLGILAPLAAVLTAQESVHNPSSITLFKVSIELKEHSRHNLIMGE
jgi:hypothetical protein